MNATIDTQLGHRTIREFTKQPVSEEVLGQLFDVAMRTPTSLGMQAASIIHVTDRELQTRFAEVGNQEYVGRAPVYLLFIVDLHRAARVLEDAGKPTAPAGFARNFVAGFTDACLMAQNMCVAAESLGLGVNFLGNIHNDARVFIRELNLPQLTMPVVGMTLGYPNQDPQLKPRMPRQMRVFENSYPATPPAPPSPPAQQPGSWTEALADYDAEMTTYYDLRNANQRVDSFTAQILGKYSGAPDLRDETVAIAREQGFAL